MVLPSPSTPLPALLSELESEEPVELEEVPCAAGPQAVRKLAPATLKAVRPESLRNPRRENSLPVDDED
jgi:hypothetical protein